MKTLSPLVLLGFAFFGIACGGASEKNETGRGHVSVAIRWPALSREIPASARSIKLVAVELTPNESNQVVEDETLQTKVASRPAGVSPLTTTVFDLPVGSVRIRATAHEAVDGSGPVLAAGSADTTIRPDQSSDASITLGQAIDTIVVNISPLNLEIGEDAQLTATAKTAGGDTVVVPSGDWSWTSVAPSIVTATQQPAPNGDKATVEAIANGNTVIRVTHVPSGKFKDIAVTVGANVGCSQFSISAGGTSIGPRNEPIEGVNNGTSFAKATQGTTVIAVSEGLSGQARSDIVFRVVAPNLSGTFTAELEFFGRLNFDPGDPVSGSATITFPGGGDSHSSFGEVTRTHTLTVKHGDVIPVNVVVNASSGSGIAEGIAVEGAVSFKFISGDVQFQAQICPPPGRAKHAACYSTLGRP